MNQMERTSEKRPPITAWAIASLVGSIVGCLGIIALPALYSSGLLQEPTGVSAGLAVLMAGALSSLLCVLGIVFGIVALRRGKHGGRAMAWVGIVLGCLPFVGMLAWAALVLWQEIGIRIGGPDAKR
jgi:hypothetical protein